jgi:chloramphenicol 3-O-phosphotransferase
MSSQSNCLLSSAQNRTIPTDPSQRRLWFSRHVDYTLAHKPLHTFEGRVILLNGFPGVGKFSIGRRLFNMLDHRHARFIDNHLLIDPVEAITPGRGTDHKALRRAFRKVAFDALCDITDRNLTLILTSCLSSTEEDQQVMEEYLAIASRRKVPFYLFNITCDRSEHHRRLLTTERSTGSKTKLIDPEILDDMLEKHKLVEIAEEGRDRPRRSGRYMFKHDTTTHCSIDESALMLYLHVKVLES